MSTTQPIAILREEVANVVSLDTPIDGVAYERAVTRLGVTSRHLLPALLAELETLRAEKAANAGLVEVGRLAIEEKIVGDSPCGTSNQREYRRIKADLAAAIAAYRASREKGAAHA
jgi:hypothetical protein